MGFTSHASECLSQLHGAVTRALEACGGIAEAHAKEYVPVVTGRLRDSISHAVAQDAVDIGTNVSYATIVELGSNGRPAKPYLRPAVENHVSEYKSTMENELKNG